jgi:hypothetical protein
MQARRYEDRQAIGERRLAWLTALAWAAFIIVSLREVL